MRGEVQKLITGGGRKKARTSKGKKCKADPSGETWAWVEFGGVPQMRKVAVTVSRTRKTQSRSKEKQKTTQEKKI